ncbi:MAG: hypothetical protein PHN88_16000, partial [Ignavibacteria bacterium]|nr:hypothetical protein [Ignavibacteria bacterium]
MSLPYADPSLPSGPAPIFTDIDANRGDHLRANNSLIWSNLSYLDAKTVNLINPISGTNLLIYQSDSGACVSRYTNLTTTSAASHGTEFGLDASEQGRIWNYENTDLIIGTNNIERMRILNSGNVGIGRTPTTLLDINSMGSASFRYNTMPLTLYRAGTNVTGITFFALNYYRVMGVPANSDDLIVGIDSGTAFTEQMRFKSTGFMGIGCDPSTPFHVLSSTNPQMRLGFDATHYWDFGMDSAGDLFLTAKSDSSGLVITPGSADRRIYFKTGTTVLFYDSGDTKVGSILHDGTNLSIDNNNGDIKITKTTEATSSTAAALISSGGIAAA